jgi:FkbH-like protein
LILSWLAPHPDFRSGLRAALSLAPAERLETLAALAQHRLGVIELIQLDRALRDVEHPVPGFSRVKVALLASSTVDHLVPALRAAGLRRKLLLDVYVGAYGQYRQELLDPNSALYRFGPQMIVVSSTAREVTAQISLSASRDEVAAHIGEAIDQLRVLWRKARDTFHATVIQQNFLDVTEPVFGSYDSQVDGAPSHVVAQLNVRLADAAIAEGVSILDVARASARDGIDAWFDVTRWLQGKFEIGLQAAPVYGEQLARIIAAHRGLSRKCLVLDLDNTLWGGVVGDDGIEGIVLGEGSGRGEAHLALQRYAKQLGERGVILAVCSKNDPATAAEVFDRHPEMILRRADIAAFVANWDDKATNLQTIARQLNIGLDSLVFVDDNAAERLRIRQSLPEVAVPELPDDVGLYIRALADAGYFESVAFTADDRQRSEQYGANASRDAFREVSQSVEDFLRGLDMIVVSGPVGEVDLARVAQLINKTNQFNPTTRRYSVEEVTQRASSHQHVALQFRLLDRFGDNGIVSAMILKPKVGEQDVLEVDVWVMSCRVFGRQLEHEVMNIAVETVRERGVRAIYAEYMPTAKNGVVRDLYASLGFRSVPHPNGAGGTTGWCLPLAEYQRHVTHISRQASLS